MTVTAFAPTSRAVFRFQATLDGALYNVSVPWNVYRQNWYVTVNDQANNLILNVPLAGSPPPPEPGVNIVGGYFTSSSTMFYYPASDTFVVAP